MKVRVASIAEMRCGLRQNREKRRRRKGSKKSGDQGQVRTGWGSPMGMNFARRVPAERIRCSFGVKECAGMGRVGRVEEVASGEW